MDLDLDLVLVVPSPLPEGDPNYENIYGSSQSGRGLMIYLFIYLHVCMYVCMYQGRIKSGRIKSGRKQDRFCIGSHQVRAVFFRGVDASV